jgi:hypothetical protein
MEAAELAAFHAGAAAAAFWCARLPRRAGCPASPAELADRPDVNAHVSKAPGLTKGQAIAMLTTRTGAGPRPARQPGAGEEHLGIDRGRRVQRIAGKGARPREQVFREPRTASAEKFPDWPGERRGGGDHPAAPARARQF